MYKLIFTTFILFVFISCNDTSLEPDGNITATTDKTSYTGISHIIVVVKNDSKSKINFSHCNYQIGFYIEKKDSNTWIDDGNIGIVCQAIYPVGIIPLESMKSIEDTIILSRPTGTYRFKYPYNLQQNGDVSKPLFSNEFYIYNPR